MPDYQQGKIYTIRCRTDDTLIYVGSTIQKLCARYSGHKTDSKRGSNMLLYSKICDNWDNWYIELYELYSCNSKEELLKKEGEVIRLIGNLNKQIAGRAANDRYKDNKEKVAEKAKIYREVNKEKIAEKAKEKGKKWRENNKEKRAEYSKKWRELNIEKRKEYEREYEKTRVRPSKI